MEPEEIDKLFRDKLAGLPVLPPADAWSRLQQKMEPPKKEKTTWLYYAAASVVILLIAGVLFLKTGQYPAGREVVTAPRPTPQKGLPPVEKPLMGQPPAIAEKNTGQEKSVKQQPGAPAVQVAAAPVRTQDKTNNPRLAAAPRRKQAPVSTRAALAAPDPRPVLAASQPAPVSTPANHMPLPAAAAVQPASLASAPSAPRVVEVVISRGPDPATDADMSLGDNLSRKGIMLKNIYKQARNLKNGEPVELAALGVDKEKIREETNELKQKISNIISR